MSNTRMPVGIVGFGVRALLIDDLLARDDIEVRAICDPSDSARARASDQVPSALVTAQLAEMLESGVEAVFVLSPDDTHAAVAKACLSAGVAVFCEKPIAISIEDADEMLVLAKQTGARLYLGHNMRHMPVVTLMREIIQSGRIGTVKAVWARHFVGHGGDYYFKDWHAEQKHVNSLLLQKGAHDIDVIHWLAGGYSQRVSGMGGLTVYGDVEHGKPAGDMMTDWISTDNWPPTEQTGVNPNVDVEDISMVTMQLDNGVFATYEQCHYTPDYWRNYTVIGTKGRLENVGDGPGDAVHVWMSRKAGFGAPDEVIEIPEASGSHGGADPLLLDEFIRFVRDGGTTETSPIAARQAVAVGVLGAESIRTDQGARDVPALDPELIRYFDEGQPGSRSGVAAQSAR
ncbi:Gfo/Idh/MocA family oxidoreductase [Microbacterium sp. H1-D42]|uniref:Gfo/Idh/MocA family protein n=1 Tax=Microbacterium sp. H1-D42 TaxID=2925844 RepID=UPI001F536B6E|nr:Gfo/Idh/MocA family oxidoreductase [Microbacterium sp. H1-D42]UNK70480.1 Gfo/Idh/MocA family oxidoreductase [Microbacterium sp. H1-D42]